MIEHPREPSPGPESGRGAAPPVAAPLTGVMGQKYAYATASLIAGVACFINLLGVEKALLAITFGVLALRAPRARLRRRWAIAGVALGVLMIAMVVVVLLLYREELARLIEHLERFG
jgi:hypothetical protein